MREILFRGKRLQGGDWVEGYFYKSDINKRERESGKATLIFTPDCDTFMFILETHNSVMVIPETIGQYTGIKDKNGTRIFEGDIVKISNDEIFEVKYEDGGFTAGLFLGDWDYGHVEVIGNIYDNPELLEVAEND